MVILEIDVSQICFYPARIIIRIYEGGTEGYLGMVNIGNRMRRLKTVSFYSVLTSPPIAKKIGF